MFEMLTPKTLVKKGIREVIQFLKYFILCVTYLSLGSLLFIYIEHCYDVVPKKLTKIELVWLETCQNASVLSLSNATTANRSNFVNNIIVACQKNNVDEDKHECAVTTDTFMKWWRYAVTVAFTIGFGNIVTRSNVGKMVTIVYAFPGIIIVVNGYMALANGFICFVKAILIKTELNVLKRKKISNLNYKVFLILTIATILTMAIDAWFHTSKDLESLNYINAFYLSFIAISTIGFGDYDIELEKYLIKPHIFIVYAFNYYASMGFLFSMFSVLADILQNCTRTTRMKGLSRVLKRKKNSYDVRANTNEKTSENSQSARASYKNEK